MASDLLSIRGAEKLSAQARVALLVLGNRWPDKVARPTPEGLSELERTGFLAWNPARRRRELTTLAWAVLSAASRSRGKHVEAWIPE